MAHTAVSRSLLLLILVPMILAWIYHLAQRRYAGVGEKKRLATMMITVLIMAIWVASYLFLRFLVDDVFLIPVLIAAAAVATWRRKLFFPYRLRCASCGSPLPLQKILFHDSNACDACDPPKPKEGDSKS